ncbi:hypothetical protein HD806DRAFT_548919 [Xylariaceae sp. AK1471]|nr:hypothetical protein HD806DRAFT_548919 [Xylariaceae sp. AK1471]
MSSLSKADDMTHVYDFSTFLKPHCFSSNFPIPEDATVSCNFITFLAAAQKLEIPFLPVTWQNNRQLLGRGGTSQISQALINQRTSFAFKRVAEKDKLFKPEQEIFRCLINEITVLDHLVGQKHPNILELQGICWDISNDSQHGIEETPLQPSDDYKVWPALVFEKSQYGDLYYFAGLPAGQQLNVEERLKICRDIGNAIAHLHSIGIIHGDIKPDNVLIFKGDDGSFTAKVADFGFSTRYSHVGDCIVLPQSQPWCAPEWNEYPEFPPAKAMKTDVFSFGMLILWFLFGKSLLGDSALPEGSQSHRAPYTYENRFHSLEFLSNLKRENSLVQFAKQLVIAEEGLDANMRQILHRFFSGCLIRDPEARHLDVQHALKYLSVQQHKSLALVQESTGHYETTELAASTMAEVYLPVDSDFKMFPSLFAFYSSEYRLRSYILHCLEGILAERPNSPLSTQLALCYALGFGRPQGGNRLEPLVYSDADFQTDLNEVVSSDPPVFLYINTLYEDIADIGHDLPLVLAEYYQEHNLLETAENTTANDIKCLESVLQVENSIVMSLKSTLSLIMSYQGKWRDAEQLESEVLTIRERILGRENPNTLNSMANLAFIYWSQGRWREAEMLEIEVVEKREKILGQEHRDTLSSKTSLAATYWKQGNWSKAESLQLEVLETSQRTFGQEHLHTHTGMLNLATTYTSQGDLEKAEKLELKVVAISQKVFGEEHPDTLIGISNLASTYRKQGRFEEAENLEVQVLDTSEKILGRKHPDTMTCMTNLASTYSGQDKFEEAEKLLVKVIALSREMLGQEHPDTMIRMTNLASVYAEQERFAEAEKLEIGILNINRRNLGQDHPDTIINMENLASTYWFRGKSEEAEKLQAEVIAAKQKVFGKGHPDTLTSMAKLGSEYSRLGEYREAEKLQVEILTIQQDFKDRPETLICMTSLAATYLIQDKFKEAEKLQVEVLDIQQKALGKHPDTLISMAMLASTYVCQDKFDEAETLQTEALDISREIFGQEHSSTLEYTTYLALTYFLQENWKEAEKLYIEAMELNRKRLGNEHPDTLDVMVSLSATYSRQSMWEEAEKLQVEVVDSSQKVLGPGHCDTLNRMAKLASIYRNWRHKLKEAEELEAEVAQRRQTAALLSSSPISSEVSSFESVE